MTDMMPKDATIFDDIKYQKQLITVATSIFAIREDKLAVLLVKRNKEPFFGQWMFPGGGVYNDESC
ncbi:MAG: NUDIX domain-containing protein, partial [Lactobacillales bacterium]|nr:NUDIX domain-containing protein [Lactobacillales bacterium]